MAQPLVQWDNETKERVKVPDGPIRVLRALRVVGQWL